MEKPQAGADRTHPYIISAEQWKALLRDDPVCAAGIIGPPESPCVTEVLDVARFYEGVPPQFVEDAALDVLRRHGILFTHELHGTALYASVPLCLTSRQHMFC